MKERLRRERPGSRDGRTVQAAQDILAGKQKKNPLSRLLPFLGPAFIASVASRVCSRTHLPCLLVPAVAPKSRD
jgi:hypothetical protein